MVARRRARDMAESSQAGLTDLEAIIELQELAAQNAVPQPETTHAVSFAEVGELEQEVSSLQEVKKDEDVSLREVQEGTEQSKFLAEASVIETRLRHHVLKLLEPVLRRQGLLEVKIKEGRVNLDRAFNEISDLQRHRADHGSVKDQLDGFRLELAQWDSERKNYSLEISEKFAMQETESVLLRQHLEGKAQEGASAVRALKGVGETLTSVRNEVSDLRRFFTERLDVNRDKILKLRDEFETRVLSVESQLHRIQDTNTQVETRIKHIQAEMVRVANTTTQTADGVAELRHSKASVTVVQELQQEFGKFQKQVDGTILEFRRQLNTLVDELKGHFKLSANMLATSTAQQMTAMREQYMEDTKTVHTLVKDTEEFKAQQHLFHQATKGSLEQIMADTKNEVFKIRDWAEQKMYKAKVESAEIHADVIELRRRMNDQTITNAQGGGAHRDGRATGVNSDVLNMIVEAELLSAVLDQQDDLDRKQIALYGLKPQEESRKTMLPDLSPRKADMGKLTGGVLTPIISLEKRCLSCSANPTTGLAGFKMACLKYAPSPIEYERVTYSRTELIGLRLDLLRQIKEQMRMIE